MFGCLRACLGKVLLLLILVLAAYGGWRWGPAVFPRVEEWLGVSSGESPAATEPTPELADSALTRIQSLQEPEEPTEVALTGPEVTSVLRYSVPGLIPDGIRGLEVELKEERVRLMARVALSSFPDLPDLGPVLGILPDTVEVRLEATLLPFGGRQAALLVQDLEASRIPLPRRLIPEILRSLGREDRPGLPPEALLVPLPAGVTSAYIRTDSLILSRQP